MQDEDRQADIRTARIDDLPVILDIAKAAFSLYLTRMDRPPAPLYAPYEQLIAAGEVSVLLAADEIVGYQVLTTASEPGKPPYLLIDILAVAPGHQGKGYGQALIRFAEEQARRQKVTEIRLYTNTAMTENLAFYPRLGFTESGYERVFFSKHL